MIIGIIIFDNIGRIPFLASTFFISQICFIGLIFSPQYVGVALIFLARMCVSTAYNTLIVYILEYYPTTIRATALGFSVTLARFAGISTSFIVQDLSTSYSSIIFAVCCFIATIATFLLPTETLGRELTDDTDDEGVDQLIINALNEYDQSTIPLMQHKPNSIIRKHINYHIDYDKHHHPRHHRRKKRNHDETELCQTTNNNSNNKVPPASQSAFF